jgi:hypothetical protein
LHFLHFQGDILFSGIEQKILHEYILSDKRMNLSKMKKIENTKMRIVIDYTSTGVWHHKTIKMKG